MALEPCRECGQKISTQAQSCPHCGAPYPARREWRGTGFEWKSRTAVAGYPLVHIAFGRDAHRKLRVAKGIVAIGQFGLGVVTVAQFGIGLLFGLGQFATGYVAIGQFALGVYALAQFGFAEHLWSVKRKDPEAVEFFRGMLDMVKGLWAG